MEGSPIDFPATWRVALAWCAKTILPVSSFFKRLDFRTVSQNWQPSAERARPIGRITSECVVRTPRPPGPLPQSAPPIKHQRDPGTIRQNRKADHVFGLPTARPLGKRNEVLSQLVTRNFFSFDGFNSVSLFQKRLSARALRLEARSGTPGEEEETPCAARTYSCPASLFPWSAQPLLLWLWSVAAVEAV